MSVVKDTISDVKLNKIPARLALYSQLIDNAEPLFNLENESLEGKCKEHAKNLMFYDLMLQECRTVEETIRTKIDEIESALYRKLNETSQRALGTRDIQQYIKSDPQFVAAQEIMLEVVHVKRQLEAIVEALKAMGWSINNITKLRIAQLEGTML
jgi:hypothetical protein